MGGFIDKVEKFLAKFISEVEKYYNFLYGSNWKKKIVYVV